MKAAGNKRLPAPRPKETIMHIGYFWAFWWLIFPIMGCVFAIVRMVLQNDYERQRLRILKSYLDQGKDIPDALARELRR